MEIGLAVLLCALIWHVFTSLVIAWNLKVFRPLPSGKPNSTPKISVLIPARNEELSIGTCVSSMLDQDYANYEVIVLDDQSTDATAERLAAFASPRLTVIHGIDKPDDWLGKPHACHRLSLQATGDILLFVDADTWFSRESLSRLARSFELNPADMVTVWPMQRLGSFWERVVVPMVYFSLLTLLPSRYVSDDPRWMPAALRARFRPLFAAACGQFIAIRRATYEAIGGHVTVKSDIVEDVALAKAVKAVGGRVVMAHGSHTVGCRMYRSHSELWNGFRKNFFAGFGYNVPFFTAAAVLHLIAYLVPFAYLTAYPRLALLVILIPVLQRMILARWYGWNLGFAFSHALGVMWFQVLGIRVLADRIFRTKMQWKGRPV
jgi:chlorobactene glucosyltransferase